VRGVVGDEATPEMMDAWEEYYSEIAQIFIDVENGMYQNADWDGYVPFEVVKKDHISDDIVRYTVKHDTVEYDLRAGQYITVKVHPTHYRYEALGHDTICSISTDDGLQVAVKK